MRLIVRRLFCVLSARRSQANRVGPVGHLITHAGHKIGGNSRRIGIIKREVYLFVSSLVSVAAPRKNMGRCL